MHEALQDLFSPWSRALKDGISLAGKPPPVLLAGLACSHSLLLEPQVEQQQAQSLLGLELSRNASREQSSVL